MRPRGRARLRACRAASEGDPVSKKAKTAEDAVVNKAAAPSAPPPLRLLSKAEVLAMVGVSFPTLWCWMRAGTFRCRGLALAVIDEIRSDLMKAFTWLVRQPWRSFAARRSLRC